METLAITYEDAQALEKSGIIKFVGRSGVDTTAVIARQAPMLCQMVSNAGDVYDLRFTSKFIAFKVGN